MKVRIDFTKSAQQNANDYYAKSKKLAQKVAGARKAITELKSRLEKVQRGAAPAEKKTIRKIVEKEWYEKFHWFYTSNGMLCIAGRDAHQNELINSKHFEDKDLFFHANIFGAAVTVLQNGKDAPPEIREEAAQFAASYSSAWKEGLHVVDVYAMRREQVSKSTSKGSLGTGSFLMSGEREWYKGMTLGIVMFVKEGRLHAVPRITFEKIKEQVGRHVVVSLGKDKKSDAAKKISKVLEFDDLDTIMQQLPAGSFRIS